MKFRCLFFLCLATSIVMTTHGQVQRQVGQLYTVQDPKNPSKPDMKINYRLDSIVGNALTGEISIYQQIQGKSEDTWAQNYKMGEGGTYNYLGKIIRLTSDDIQAEKKDRSTYIFYTEKAPRSFALYDYFTISKKDHPSTVPLSVSFSSSDARPQLYYPAVPIIWHTPPTQYASRPAEYYLSEHTVKNGTTKVIPFDGPYTRIYKVEYGVVDNYPDPDVDIRIVGMIGNRKTGQVRPILKIMTSYNTWFNWQTIKSLVAFDDNGDRHELSTSKGWSESFIYRYYTPFEMWVEANDIVLNVDPTAESIQKLTLTTFSSTEYSDHYWEFVFKNIPIQWLDM